MAGGVTGFEQGVFDKGGGGFFRFSHAKVSLRPDLEAAQQGLNFLNFTTIVAG